MDPMTLMGLSGAAQSAFGLGSQMIGGYQGRKLAKKTAKYARWNAAWSAKELPAMTVSGLRKANLNPILAVGGMRSSMAGGSTAGGIGAGARAADLAGAYQAASSGSLAKMQRALVVAQTKKAYQESSESFARTQLQHFLANSAQAQAFIDHQVKDVFASPLGRRVLPLMQASSRAGLRPDLALGILPATAGQLAKYFIGRRRGSIGFGRP